MRLRRFNTVTNMRFLDAFLLIVWPTERQSENEKSRYNASSMRYLILAALVFSLIVTPGFGQRVFGEAEPTTMSADFRFGVNNGPFGATPTGPANGFPGLVFSQDSSKAFVGLSGESEERQNDHVMVFDPRTGEVLALVPVALNPTQLALTPDGESVAVVSILAQENQPKVVKPGEEPTRGVISLIDVQTLEVQSIEILDVVFSAFNNVVFSEDGRTGFVASASSDEIVRFDAQNLQEIDRLPLEGGSRPITLTMSPDFRFFTVVTVGTQLGSDERDVFENPDFVAVIDTESFTLRTQVKPDTRLPDPEEDGEDLSMFDVNLLPHDFVGVNWLEFSPDGKYGMLADQRDLTGSGSGTFIPSLGTNRAWLIDFEANQVVQSFQVGGLAMGTFWAPSGEFVVVSDISFTFINPFTRESERINTPIGNFAPGTVPAFSRDGQLMYLPSPSNDTLLVVNLQTREITRAVTLGNNSDVFPAAPMHAAVSPDGEIIAVINFNANQVELLRQTHRFFVPRVFADAEFFTGVAVTNATGSDVELLVSGFNDGGFILRDNTTTEEVEFVNPRLLELENGSQLAETAGQLVQAGEAFTGWLDFDSDVTGLSSFFLTGDTALTRLDGSLSQLRTSRKILIPEVRVTDGMNTEVVLMNPNLNSTSTTIQLFDRHGELVTQVTRTVARTAVLSVPLRDPDPDNAATSGLFEDSVLEGLQDGYMIVSSDHGLVAAERYFDSRRMSVLNGVPLSAEELQATRLIAPQVAVFGGSDTFLNLINTSEEEIRARVTLRSDDGETLAGPVLLILAGGEAFRRSIKDFLNLSSAGGLVTGWLEVISVNDRPGLSGDVEIQLFDGRAMTTLGLLSRSEKTLIFSHVGQGAGFSTGLALLNSGQQGAAALIEIFRPDGTLVESGQFFIEAGRRDVRLLSGDPDNEFFPGLPQQVGGYIRVTSDQPLIGLEIFFSNNFEMASTVPAQTVEIVE